MGSSSKKSKKDSKQKKHKRSSPSYERDNSYSPDEKRRRHDSGDEERRSSKHKKHHKKRSKRDQESESPRKEERRESRREEKSEVNGRSKRQEIPGLENDSGTNREGAASLSIEETNKLREKLGLKPLDVGDNSAKDGGDDQKEEFVHAPAEDLWEKKKQEELREKLKAIKEKRNINKKIGKVKKITDEDEMDAASWVQRSRKSEQKKKQAEDREKEMARMDAEFGLGGLVKKELSDMRNESYTSKDLKGMKVRHSLGLFKEGKSEILTLQDQNILDEENEDVLVGTNLMDAEKTKRNIEIRSKGAGYQAYEDEEVDELGFFKPKSMLSKYDEEIEGIKQDEFKIGSRGKIDMTWEKQKEDMKKEIKASGVSLAPPQLKIASEYLTEEEMKFKKRKKKVRKVRKRETFKADDLLPLPGTSSISDLGSRGKMQPGSIPGWDEGIEVARVDDTSITSTSMKSEAKTVVIDEDDAGNELQKALDKARKAKFVKAKMVSDDTGATKVAQHLQALNRVKIENPTANYSQTISLNSTDEFCRQVGIGSDLRTNKEEPMHEESSMEELDMDVDNIEEEAAGWNYVKDNTEEAGSSKQHHPEPQEEDHAPIEAEPLAGGGLAGALQLFERKGYLVEEVKKSSVTLTNQQRELLSANYSIEDKNAVDHLDKYAHEKYSKDRNRHDRGIVTEFEEKKNYKPQIKIDYVDEKGRAIDPKEAFRKLSHRFHGKGSGKMKQEKRQKKRQEQDMMMRMSSTDTPLNTVAMMKEKLQTEASPYIVLSGGGKTFQTGGGPMAKK